MRVRSVFRFVLVSFVVALFMQFAFLPMVCEAKSGSSKKSSLKELGKSLKELTDSLKELGDSLKSDKPAQESHKQPAEIPADAEQLTLNAEDIDAELEEDEEEPEEPQPAIEQEVKPEEQQPASKHALKRYLKTPVKANISLGEDGTESAFGLPRNDRLWRKPTSEILSPVSGVTPMQINPPLDINKLTQAQYNGAVSAAMEAMRVLMGEFSEEDESRFNAKWAPYFNHPTEEMAEYLNQLNPLLSEFLSLRAAMASASVEFDAAWEEAVLAASYDSEEGAAEGLALAAMQKDYLQSLHARMVEVARAIQTLGNPPNPIEAQAQAQKQHKEAVELASNTVIAEIAAKAAAQKKANSAQSKKAENKGAWVLVEQVKMMSPPPKESDGNRSYWTHSENGFECKSFLNKDLLLHCHHSWEEPPKTLVPGTKLDIKVNLKIGEDKGGGASIFVDFIGAEDRNTKQGSAHYDTSYRNLQGIGTMIVPVSSPWNDSLRIRVVCFQGFMSQAGVDYVYKLDKNIITDADTSAPQITSTANTQDTAVIAARKEMNKENIEFCRANIVIIERHLAKDREELARETDPERKAAIEFRIMHKMSDLQAEKDMIASLETGEYVRTRTPFDDYAMAQFVQNIKDNHREMEAFQRSTTSLYRLAGMLPPEEAQQAREFVDRQLTMDVRSNMDKEAVKKIGSALGKKVQGHYQSEAAKNDESAAWANFGMEASQYVKSGADFGMVVCSVMGGRPLTVAYQATTGYIDGGPVEAVLRTASTFGTTAHASVEAFRGYREGGIKAAAYRGASAYIKGKAIEYGVTKIMQGIQPKTDGPTVQEQLELAEFKQARTDGESLVRDFHRTQLQLEAAASKGATNRELLKLQGQLREKAAAINSNMHAKNFLKYKGELHAQRAYNAHMGSIHAEVEAKFHTVMTKQGWNKQTLVEFRNAASAGSVGIDYDIGLKESSAMNLLKNGQRGTVDQWQSDAQKAWGQVYKEVTNHSADRAWENVTSSVHAESYRDLAWLGADKSKVNATWAQQSADVTRYKAWHMLNDTSLTPMERLQEVSRGTAKDINTKLQPLLNSAKPANNASAKALSGAKDHWQKIYKTLNDFGINEIDPITAKRKIKEITGGKSIPEVVEDMGTLMESLVSRVGK